MSSIVKYTCEALAGAVVSCIIENGVPWFKAKDVATALQYKHTDKAIRQHVSDDDKRLQSSLISKPPKSPGLRDSCKITLSDSDNDKSEQGSNPGESPGLKDSCKISLSDSGNDKSEQGSNPGESPGLKGNWKNVLYINESGLFCLIFGSDMAEAKVFKHWVTREVLPEIRRTGSYNGKYDYWRNVAELGTTSQQRWKEVRRLAIGREDELHYSVIEHIKKHYPDATINAGIGEHLTTDHARMDAYLKGYTGGQPDIIVIRGLPNGFQDVLAIELKNPNKKGKLSDKQVEYIDNLQINCRAKAIVSRDYDEIIIAMHEHYRDVFARAQTLADTPITYDFSSNENPQYWCNKLRNGPALVEQCRQRGIAEDEVRISTKREIASILITFDKKRKLA